MYFKFINQYIWLQMESVGHCQIAQIESMFVGHFQIVLNPYEFWRTLNRVNVLHTHTLSYLMPYFERFLMTPLSARSTLVKLTLTKNLTSNGSKPIWVLKIRNLWKRENLEPIGYSLPCPIFSLIGATFLIHSTFSRPGLKEVDTKGIWIHFNLT